MTYYCVILENLQCKLATLIMVPFHLADTHRTKAVEPANMNGLWSVMQQGF